MSFPRELDGHHVNPANRSLRIMAVDRPGSGGANHRYEITGFDIATNPSGEGLYQGGAVDGTPMYELVLLFQNGPISAFGVNGITQEALLEVCIDRLRSFQSGPFACDENAEALSHLLKAREALLSRTRARMARGVEGTHEK